MITVCLVAVLQPFTPIAPVRSEVVAPICSESFTKNGTARERKQGGNPRTLAGNLVFDGATDGDSQVDPQIAVGNGKILHGTNKGMIVYDTAGTYVAGVTPAAFNGGIDPKLFYDRHRRNFAFDLWNPWDKEKKKPVNVSVSATDDPTKAWNTYPVPAPAGVDGGGIGYSKSWVGYSFPGGPEQTFVIASAELASGKPATVHHFAGNLGQPVHTLDALDDLYFVALRNREIVLTKVAAGPTGTPVVAGVVKANHNFKHFGWPPAAPQKGTDGKVAAGDRNPKNLVIRGGCLWFSQTVNIAGRAGIQWHQVKLDGTFVQSGEIAHATHSYIQTTLAVNKNLDVLIGFQEAGPAMFVSPRYALHKADDKPGSTRGVVSLGEGAGAAPGGAWGDYSGTVVDPDNDTDFWTVQSIATAKGKGATVIARVRP
jgi:hypothetical protein